ncbi:MAG: helix-turn-helix transcriptional regulator [Patescibacteria group bacterium]|jgi:DNA-binding XRE family transcriptional regulator
MSLTKLKSIDAVDFDDYLAEQLKDPEFRKWYDYYGKQLETAYQILQLRRQKKMSQATLAKKIGTTQSNLARLEAGNQNFTVGMMNKIAKALDRELKIEFI